MAAIKRKHTLVFLLKASQKKNKEKKNEENMKQFVLGKFKENYTHTQFVLTLEIRNTNPTIFKSKTAIVYFSVNMQKKRLHAT